MNDKQDDANLAPRSAADQKLRSLIAVMQSGSGSQVKRAQTEFYTLLHGQLKRASLARAVDSERFKDLFQETMIAVWDGLPRFRGESSIVTWVHGIFRNKVNDFLRSAHFRQVDQLNDEASLLILSQEQEVTEMLMRQQVERFLNGCLKRLWQTSRNRAAAIEFVRQEYSMEEISASLDAPVGTVKRWLHEARHELAACIKRHGVQGIEG